MPRYCQTCPHISLTHLFLTPYLQYSIIQFIPLPNSHLSIHSLFTLIPSTNLHDALLVTNSLSLSLSLSHLIHYLPQLVPVPHCHLSFSTYFRHYQYPISVLWSWLFMKLISFIIYGTYAACYTNAYWLVMGRVSASASASADIRTIFWHPHLHPHPHEAKKWDPLPHPHLAN